MARLVQRIHRLCDGAPGPCSRSRSHLHQLAMPLALAAAVVAPAAAQMPEGEATVPFCAVGSSPVENQDYQRVYASCQGIGLILGEADRFEAFYNTALQATLVELEVNGMRRVLLLRPDVDGQPMLEDMTGTLAASAGRAPWSDLDGVAVDYTQFAESGAVSVREMGGLLASGEARQQRTRVDAGLDAASAGAAQGGTALSIGDHIASDPKQAAH